MRMLKNLAAATLSLAVLAPLAAHAGVEVLNEGFSDLTALPGWTQLNNSAPAGAGWFQGNASIFPAQAGAATAYAAANYLSAQDGSGSVDSWLITPVLNLSGTTIFSFFTRTASDPGFADKLEVRFAPGSGADTSEFATLLATVGTAQYPRTWTQVSSSFQFDGTGRFAFRYLGDAAALNYIGIDSVRVITAVPEPSLSLMLSLGLGALALLRRKNAN